MSIVKKPSFTDLVKLKGSVKDAIKELVNSGEDIYVLSREHNIPLHIILMYINNYEIKSDLKFIDIIQYFNKINSLQSIKGKTTELTKYLNEFPIDYEMKIRFILGRLVDEQYKLGEDSILEALRLSVNRTKSEMQEYKISYGECGDIAFLLAKDRKPGLLLDEVYYTIKILTKLGNYKKILCLASLFNKTNKEEAKYLCRLIRKKLYLGLTSQGIVNAVCQFLKVNPNLLNDAVLVKGTIQGLLLAQYGNKALEDVKIKVGYFVQPQLASMFDRRYIKYPVRVELKYDGVRLQIHKIGNKVWIFSRGGIIRNEAYPELIDIVKQINSSACILDGELIGIKNGKIIPFTKLLTITNKKSYDEITSKDIKLKLKIFGVLFHNKPVIGYSFEHRLGILRQIVPNEYLAEGTLCQDFKEVMNEYDKVIKEGNEGIVIKDLEAKYYPDRRHRSWLKLKAERDTLDVVVTKAKYGKGRLAGYFASLRLAVRHPTEKMLYEIGDCGGFTEYQMIKWDHIFKEITTSKDSEGVNVIPHLIIEVAFYEIVRSKTYTSGFALRNPRFIRIRRDKDINQIDTINKIRTIYEQFKK